MPVPDSWNRILGFLDYAHLDITPSEIASNAPEYSFVWSAMTWQVSQFRAANPSMNIGRYIPAFLDDHNARPDPIPEDLTLDTPERRARTLRWWNNEVDGVGHPDWVMYTCDSVTPAYYNFGGSTQPNMPLDFSNLDVVDWQLRNSGTSDDSEHGYTALSADLVYLRNFDHACGIYRNGQWVQLFTGEETDPAYAAAVRDWARRMRARLHALPSPRGLVTNSPPFYFYSDEEFAALTANLDGVLDEAGFTGFGSRLSYPSGEGWLHKVRNLVAMQRQGVALYSQNYVERYPPSAADLDWILSSFLMAKEHAAYVSVTINASPEPGIRWPHLSEYEADLGHPCASMRAYENVYVRDYTKGMAVVNPSATDTFTVTLPAGSFRDLHGAQIEGNTLVLPPQTGKVLLSSLNRCP